jgi:hypothetical protein
LGSTTICWPSFPRQAFGDHAGADVDAAAGGQAVDQGNVALRPGREGALGAQHAAADNPPSMVRRVSAAMTFSLRLLREAYHAPGGCGPLLGDAGIGLAGAPA